MAGERSSRRMSDAVSSQRRRRGLSNITNLPAINHWSNENEVVKSWNNNSRELELEEENRRLQQVILEKDGQIESQKLYIQQMQRDYLTNLFRRTQQNEDIICYNSRLSKELLSVREQLKFLQHAHTQMAVVYRINENEFQVKLAAMSQQLKKALQEKECEEALQVQVPRRTRTSLRRLSVIGGPDADMGKPLAKASSAANDTDSTSITTRSSSRQRSGSTSYGESSLKAKIKEQNSASLASSGLYTGPQKRYNNRYGHISGLETMQELCEDLETSQAHTVTTEASTVTVRRSRRRSSIEPFANELTDQSNQSSCNGRPTGDVASTSESCSRSAEHTRYCEKSPGPRSCTPQRPSTPQRPGTPQKRSISQPATSPRKKAEPQTKSPARTKATRSSSQASTPRSSSPVALSSSLKRPPRAASPSLQQQQHDGMDQSRSSLAGSRPIRRAAEVVVSYKEPSLITKMRRPA
ncbi:unnamed protein product [Sphagnum troendelagicum]|uniref:Shugoshin C-terminal domain-containing protein n=1 Tax=Sphagnum troendelagicum TaxID=128251 RepID=A0ABP0UZM9_9BRYO